jgi:hypothetical protein
LAHQPLHVIYCVDLLASVIADITDFVPFGVAHLNHLVGILFGMLVG